VSGILKYHFHCASLVKESEERWEGKREIENRIDLCFAEIEESRVKSKDKSKE